MGLTIETGEEPGTGTRRFPGLVGALQFGAEGETRTPTTLRSLEPESMAQFFTKLRNDWFSRNAAAFVRATVATVATEDTFSHSPPHKIPHKARGVFDTLVCSRETSRDE